MQMMQGQLSLNQIKHLVSLLEQSLSIQKAVNGTSAPYVISTGKLLEALESFEPVKTE